MIRVDTNLIYSGLICLSSDLTPRSLIIVVHEKSCILRTLLSFCVV